MTGAAPPLVVVDACVLVAYDYTCLLLDLAEAGLIDLRWSSEILVELKRALVEKRGLSPDRAAGRIEKMQLAFPLAEVHGWEDHVEDMHCDLKDRHVLAAAVEAQSDFLLTANLKDFPPDACESYGVEVTDPDTFLMEIFALDPETVREVVRAEAAHRSRPAMTPHDLLAAITLDAPTAANMIAHGLDDPEMIPPDLPALVRASERPSEIVEFETSASLENPLHVAWTFAQSLADDLSSQRLEDLRLLVHHPRPWGDFAWAAEMLDDLGWATHVYRAVDRPDELAFVRFLRTEGSVRVIGSAIVRGRWSFATMLRRPDGTWRVWGLGQRMVSWRQVAR